MGERPAPSQQGPLQPPTEHGHAEVVNIASRGCSSTGEPFPNNLLLSDPNDSTSLAPRPSAIDSVRDGSGPNPSSNKGASPPASQTRVAPRLDTHADSPTRDTASGVETSCPVIKSSPATSVKEEAAAVKASVDKEAAASDSSNSSIPHLSHGHATPEELLERSCPRVDQEASASLIEEEGLLREPRREFVKAEHEENEASPQDTANEQPCFLYIQIIGPGKSEKKATTAKRVKLSVPDAPPARLVMTVREPGAYSVLVTASAKWTGRYCIEGETCAEDPIEMATFCIPDSVFQDASGNRLREATCSKCGQTVGSKKRTINKYPFRGTGRRSATKLRLLPHKGASLSLVADLIVYASIPDPGEKLVACHACAGVASSPQAFSLAKLAQFQSLVHAPVATKITALEPSTVPSAKGDAPNATAATSRAATHDGLDMLSDSALNSPKAPAPDELKSSVSSTTSKVARVTHSSAGEVVTRSQRPLPSSMPPVSSLDSPENNRVSFSVGLISMSEEQAVEVSPSLSAAPVVVETSLPLVPPLAPDANCATRVEKSASKILPPAAAIGASVGGCPVGQEINRDAPDAGSLDALAQLERNADVPMMRGDHRREILPGAGLDGRDNNNSGREEDGSGETPVATAPSGVLGGSLASAAAASERPGVTPTDVIREARARKISVAASTPIASRSSFGSLEATAPGDMQNTEPVKRIDAKGDACGKWPNSETTLVEYTGSAKACPLLCIPSIGFYPVSTNHPTGGDSKGCTCEANDNDVAMVAASGRSHRDDNSERSGGNGSAMNIAVVARSAAPVGNSSVVTAASKRSGATTSRTIQSIPAARIPAEALISTTSSSSIGSLEAAGSINMRNSEPVEGEDSENNACGTPSRPDARLIEPTGSVKAHLFICSPHVAPYPASAKREMSSEASACLSEVSKDYNCKAAFSVTVAVNENVSGSVAVVKGGGLGGVSIGREALDGPKATNSYIESAEGKVPMVAEASDLRRSEEVVEAGRADCVGLQVPSRGLQPSSGVAARWVSDPKASTPAQARTLTSMPAMPISAAASDMNGPRLEDLQRSLYFLSVAKGLSAPWPQLKRTFWELREGTNLAESLKLVDPASLEVFRKELNREYQSMLTVCAPPAEVRAATAEETSALMGGTGVGQSFVDEAASCPQPRVYCPPQDIAPEADDSKPAGSSVVASTALDQLAEKRGEILCPNCGAEGWSLNDTSARQPADDSMAHFANNGPCRVCLWSPADVRPSDRNESGDRPAAEDGIAPEREQRQANEGVYGSASNRPGDAEVAKAGTQEAPLKPTSKADDVAYGVDDAGRIAGSPTTSSRLIKTSVASPACLAVSQASSFASGSLTSAMQSGGSNANSVTGEVSNGAFVAGGCTKRKGEEAFPMETVAEAKPRSIQHSAAQEERGRGRKKALLKQAIVNAELLHLRLKWMEGGDRASRENDLLARVYLAEGDPIIPSNTERSAPIPGGQMPFDAIFPDYEKQRPSGKPEGKAAVSENSGKACPLSAFATRGEELEPGAHRSKRRRRRV